LFKLFVIFNFIFSSSSAFPQFPGIRQPRSDNLFSDYSLFSNNPTWAVGDQDLFGQRPGSMGGPSPLERLLQQQQQQQQQQQNHSRSNQF
jgi:hypothetical protein